MTFFEFSTVQSSFPLSKSSPFPLLALLINGFSTAKNSCSVPTVHLGLPSKCACGKLFSTVKTGANVLEHAEQIFKESVKGFAFAIQQQACVKLFRKCAFIIMQITI